MVMGWKNAPTWMRFGCIVFSISIGIFLSKLIYGYLNYLMMIFIAVIMFAVFHSVDAKEWKFKCPSWRISFKTDVEYVDGTYNKHNWNRLGLNKLQSTWLFLLCLMKDDRDSYKVFINGRVYWVWGEQAKHYTVMYRMRQTRTFDTLPDSIYESKTIGGRQHKPKNCQTFKMPSTTENQLLKLAAIRYKEISKVEDIFEMLKISDYKFLSKFRGPETIFRTY